MTFTINKNNSYNQYQHTNNNSKNLYIIYFILLLLVKTVGAQKTQFFFPNGNVSSEGMLKDGQPDGYWKTYFENGTLKSEGNRSNFSLDSTWKFYFSTGQLNKIINYKKNNKNGFFFLYSKEGFLLEKVNYLEDNRNGEALIFKAFVLIDSTFLKEKNNYKNNVLNDFCYSYDSIGNIITIKKYNLGMLLSKEKINRYDKNNQRHGKWKTFYANGKIEWEADYLHGKLNGKEKKYNKKGGIETIENYTDSLSKLGFKFNKKISVPSYRSDIMHQNDLAEEFARLIGYNNIPKKNIHLPLKPESKNPAVNRFLPCVTRDDLTDLNLHSIPEPPRALKVSIKDTQVSTFISP